MVIRISNVLYPTRNGFDFLGTPLKRVDESGGSATRTSATGKVRGLMHMDWWDHDGRTVGPVWTQIRKVPERYS